MNLSLNKNTLFKQYSKTVTNCNKMSYSQHRAFHSSQRTLALSQEEVKKGIDSLTDQFMEARELLEDARESLGTTYFSEDMQDAQTAVKDTLAEYAQLLSQLSDKQKEEVVRTIGLKMEELKAQEMALNEELVDQ